MFELKRLPSDAIAGALAKAERYRLLNEPVDAESICRDILDIDPDNQQALIDLVLSLTDQFALGRTDRLAEVRETAGRLSDVYERAYYTGIVCERYAKAIHRRGLPDSGGLVHEWLTRAMGLYEQAEGLRPDDNEDAILRWNSCARIIMQHPDIQPAEDIASPVDLE